MLLFRVSSRSHSWGQGSGKIGVNRCRTGTCRCPRRSWVGTAKAAFIGLTSSPVSHETSYGRARHSYKRSQVQAGRPFPPTARFAPHGLPSGWHAPLDNPSFASCTIPVGTSTSTVLPRGHCSNPLFHVKSIHASHRVYPHDSLLVGIRVFPRFPLLNSQKSQLTQFQDAIIGMLAWTPWALRRGAFSTQG